MGDSATKPTQQPSGRHKEEVMVDSDPFEEYRRMGLNERQILFLEAVGAVFQDEQWEDVSGQFKVVPLCSWKKNPNPPPQYICI